MTLVELALVVLSLPLCAACGYLLLLTAAAVRRPGVLVRGPRSLPRFEIIVPAHDEQEGITATVASLRGLEWPADRFRITVVSDNCSDHTAARAAAAGARVLVRIDPARRGKGYALAHAFERLLREEWADAAVVIDADSTASPNLLAAFAARLAAGELAVQADYAVQNPDASWRTRLMAVALGLFHVLRSLGRERLGLSCGLRGNGMCFSAALLRKVPHRAVSLAEDVEYGLRLGEAGVRVAYAEEAHVYGEMVAGEGASRSQRRRWEQGRAALRRRAAALLWRGLREKSALLTDLALDVLVPPLSTLAAFTVLGLGVAGAASLHPATSAPWWSFAACAAALFAYALRGWALSGTGWQGLAALARAPAYVAWKLLLAVQRPSQPRGAWVRTARERSAP